MKVAFIIFEDLTALDFIGVYDAVTRLKTMNFIPELEWEICSFTERVVDGTGLIFTPTKVNESLETYDMVIVPGGFGTRRLVDDSAFIEWLKTSKPCKIKASVCTGSLLYGSAGFLQGKSATTHPSAFENLKKYCTVVDDRIVDEGDVITARGVSSSIDLGLYLCEKLAGHDAKEKIRIQMDYQIN
ncbi:DJ-1/PfpI family protein [Schinkia azotoformans]|uniref:DJ-1/PfpI family protein n=1 Tax=Schinkia azotoformans TaxID=1454 RepID=UPI002DBE79A5|nr:DJ-1/PfpI family protein [Schinkia azotoformans]MEC1773689.1 DJ-1/PfpI family protein [Schinkia azotoformans]MED4366154.1 DJ-1/PfpI family protein [Schinkia azotoformans]MED4376543.1 DJ-1/PfpI family protein [Schinkia azotoformans]